jgi:hypothetical protein
MNARRKLRIREKKASAIKRSAHLAPIQHHRLNAADEARRRLHLGRVHVRAGTAADVEVQRQGKLGEGPGREDLVGRFRLHLEGGEATGPRHPHLDPFAQAHWPLAPANCYFWVY